MKDNLSTHKFKYHGPNKGWWYIFDNILTKEEREEVVKLYDEEVFLNEFNLLRKYVWK